MPKFEGKVAVVTGGSSAPDGQPAVTDDVPTASVDETGIPRREFLKRTMLTGGGLALSGRILSEPSGPPPERSTVDMPGSTGPTTTVRLNINTRDYQLRL